LLRNPVSEFPQSKKPGFYDDFRILTEILVRNPVSEFPQSKKPGFYDDFRILTEI